MATTFPTDRRSESSRTASVFAPIAISTQKSLFNQQRYLLDTNNQHDFTSLFVLAVFVLSSTLNGTYCDRKLPPLDRCSGVFATYMDTDNTIDNTTNMSDQAIAYDGRCATQRRRCVVVMLRCRRCRMFIVIMNVIIIDVVDFQCTIGSAVFGR